MMSVDSRPSSNIPIADKVPPQSFNSGGTASTGWIDAGKAAWILAVLNVGAVGGGGQVALTWLQATDSGGAGSKALSAGAFAETDVTTANTPKLVEEVVEKLDIANGFRFVKATLTITVATCIAGVIVCLGAPRFETGPTIST